MPSKHCLQQTTFNYSGGKNEIGVNRGLLNPVWSLFEEPALSVDRKNKNWNCRWDGTKVGAAAL